MTSEVALMNRSAVALAADSATTITYWQDGERHRRYAKGANKIFNLSNAQPVGLMIFAADNLQGIPWEVLTKAYREEADDGPFSNLSDYPASLFEFLTKNPYLFPAKYQDDELIEGVKDTAINIGLRAAYDRNVRNEPDEVAKQAAASTNFENIKRESEAADYLTPKCKDLSTRVVSEYFDRINQSFNQDPIKTSIGNYLDTDDLVRLACDAFFKTEWTQLSRTGLVFAGFGTHQYFPHLEQYDCYGVLLGEVICDHKKDDGSSISHASVSEIVPIAQSEMVDTFMYGSSIDVLTKMDELFLNGVDSVIDDIKASGALDQGFDHSGLKVAAQDTFKDHMREYIWTKHSTPMRRAVGFLPIDDLAELAESLVSIESLKERVTSSTESVSGPIDVAVITKGDGFIWIKRKHYFEPALNLRYVASKT